MCTSHSLWLKTHSGSEIISHMISQICTNAKPATPSGYNTKSRIRSIRSALYSKFWYLPKEPIHAVFMKQFASVWASADCPSFSNSFPHPTLDLMIEKKF